MPTLQPSDLSRLTHRMSPKGYNMPRVILDRLCTILHLRATAFTVALFLLPLLSVPQILLAKESAATYKIADNSVTSYVIVHAEDATAIEVFAAHQLSDYLQKITGAEFPVLKEQDAPSDTRMIVGQGVLCQKALGQERIAQLRADEFIIRGSGSDILLVGERPLGTLYAIYSFLERELGCRWLNWYGDEFVPQAKSVSLKEIDRTSAPAFDQRDIYLLYYHKDISRIWPFMVANGVTHQLPANLKEKTGCGGLRYVRHSPAVHSLFYYLVPEIGNHALQVLPKEIEQQPVFKEHPEYFSLIDGMRVTTHQLCFSNPGLRKRMTDSVLSRMHHMNGRGVFDLSAMDIPGDFCQCSACQAMVRREGIPGAPLLDYLVELGQEVKKTYPKAWLSTLAYRRLQTEKPPDKLVLPDNLIVVFAPIDNNFAASFQHPSNAETLKNLKGWAAKNSKLWVWYYTNPYGDATLPIGNLTKMGEDFRLFKQVGVTGFFIQHDAGVSDSHRLADLQTWLVAKLMWNPDQDLEMLIQDFTDAYYGAASETLRQYIALLEDATRSTSTTIIWSPSPSQFTFLTPTFLETAQTIFDNAEAAVSTDPVQLSRVRQARMSLDKATLTFWNTLGQGSILGMTKEKIAHRYKQTYTETVRQRMAPQYQATHLQSLNATLKPLLMMTRPKPLPKQLQGFAPQRIRQLLPHVSGSSGSAEIQGDPQAAVGICVTRATDGELPFTLGYYDESARKFTLNKKIEKWEITSPSYQLHKLGRTTLNERCVIWITRSWQISFSPSSFYDRAEPDRQWDIYVSLRFEGPTYIEATKDKTDRVYVDQVILVKADG